MSGESGPYRLTTTEHDGGWTLLAPPGVPLPKRTWFCRCKREAAMDRVDELNAAFAAGQESIVKVVENVKAIEAWSAWLAYAREAYNDVLTAVREALAKAKGE